MLRIQDFCTAFLIGPRLRPQAKLACSILNGMRFVSILLLALCLQSATAQTPKQAPEGNAETLVRAAEAAQQHGDHKTAIDDYRKALAIQPGLAKAHAGLG